MFDFLVGQNVLSSIIAFGLVLIPAIFIHELGHFIAAKMVGITILEFGIGFPPKAAHLFTWRGTEFTLNYLPLGGFVRPLGEDMIKPLSEGEVEDDRKAYVNRSHDNAQKLDTIKAVNEAKPLSRIVFMAAGAFANFVSAFILFVIIALIGLPEIIGGRINVLFVDPTSGLGVAGLQAGDFIEGINNEKFADSEDFFDKLESLESDTATLNVRRFTDDDEEIVTTITFNPKDVPVSANRDGVVHVLDVAPQSPAALAGLRANDLITALNGEEIESTSDLQSLTRDNLGTEIVLDILRDNEPLSISLTPRTNPPPGQGAIGIVILPAFRRAESAIIYQDGVPQREIVPQSLSEGVTYAFNRIGNTLGMIFNLPVEIIQGTTSIETARPVSVVGISQFGGRTLEQSIEEDRPVLFLEFIALISIALGFTNLLPLPALDGGRILFVVIEIIRGRPVAPERESLVHMIGLALLLSITLLFILNDLINPITDSLP